MAGTARLLRTACVLLLAPVSAWASSFTVDQSNPFNCPGPLARCYSQDPYARPLLQTFTPTFDSIDAADLWVADIHDDATNSPSTARLTIRLGNNIQGTILGFAEASVQGPGYSPGSPFKISFSFGSPIGLSPGTVYSWQFSIAGGDDDGLSLWGTQLDPYPGGTGYNGGSDSGGDWFFSEGRQTADESDAVPEPATLLLLGTGLSLAAKRRVRTGPGLR